jgi:Cdc6-like AAA superfamily ATPase
MMKDQDFEIIAHNLSPERPIRSSEYLRGRTLELDNIERELRFFHPAIFIYGNRGVGKTSLARTAAQLVTPADREHIYVACAPGSRMLNVLREIGEELLKLIFRCVSAEHICKQVEIEISLTPAIRTSFEKRTPVLPIFDNATSAIRVIRELDSLLPNAKSTVIVLDELEELNDHDRTDLAYLIKQLGDQEFQLKFILVGIAENVHELIGIHQSVPRYLKEVALHPLAPQDLIDIVKNAADALHIEVPSTVLYRIAIVGNGYPHFAHLMGKALLIEAVLSSETQITEVVYKSGVARAVGDSLQELRISYEAATQRGQDYFKHLVWALAHSDIVDVRIDEWIYLYHELVKHHNWTLVDEDQLRTAIGNFNKSSYGEIIVNTPSRYGESEIRYRYKRFRNTLMRGHVRLQAENEGITLGKTQIA